MKKTSYIISGIIIAVIAILTTSVVAAQNVGQGRNPPVGNRIKGIASQIQQKSGISGIIASISGTTITLKSEDSYTITIDASSATVKRNVSATSTSSSTSTPISVSDLQVGDLITVKGNINIVAAEIAAGRKPASPSPAGTIGTVTSISGTTITITSKQPVSQEAPDLSATTTTYTIDASSATITKGVGKNASTAALSDIAVGNNIDARGTISGTNITASSISIINIPTNSNENGNEINGNRNGIWNKISDFFGKMFTRPKQ